MRKEERGRIVSYECNLVIKITRGNNNNDNGKSNYKNSASFYDKASDICRALLRLNLTSDDYENLQASHQHSLAYYTATQQLIHSIELLPNC